MKTIIIFIATTLLLGCSPQKRLNRLIANHPELTTDTTITIHDTVTINGSSIDTTFSASADTIVIHDSIMTITYIHDKVTNRVYLKGDVTERLIPITKVVTIKSPVVKEIKYKEYWWLKYLIGVAVFSLLVNAGVFYFRK